MEKNMSFEDWSKECVSTELIKHTCRCHKEWTYGEVSPYDGSFHDGSKLATLINMHEEYNGTDSELTIFLCDCGLPLKAILVGSDIDNLDFDYIHEVI